MGGEIHIFRRKLNKPHLFTHGTHVPFQKRNTFQSKVLYKCFLFFIYIIIKYFRGISYYDLREIPTSGPLLEGAKRHFIICPWS